MELKDLKREYEKLESKHKLPNFEELNRDFEIDKLDKQSDKTLRAIRKIIMEKIDNSMRFLEMLINPMNTPRMYLSYINSMTHDDRKVIDNIYSSLADLSIISLELEIDTTEENEASLIKRVFNKWQELKGGFKQIITNIKMPKNSVSKKERNYFG